jgi:hypothetical protein
MVVARSPPRVEKPNGGFTRAQVTCGLSGQENALALRAEATRGLSIAGTPLPLAAPGRGRGDESGYSTRLHEAGSPLMWRIAQYSTPGLLSE